MTKLSDNLRGAMLMVASMAAFTFNDACMKALSDELPLFQAIFMRGVAATAMMVVLTQLRGGFDFSFSRRDWGLVVLRTVAEAGTAFLFISAIFNMPIGNATAILQALPLTVSLAGAVFLGEAVGWRRLGAITVGFFGILMIVQPGADGFNTYSIYAILAVLVITVRDLASRRLSAGVSSLTVATISALGVTVSAGIASIGEVWVQPDALVWLQLTGAATFIIGGYLFGVMTMRVGDIGFIAPYRYTGLLWALVLGFVVFGEIPNGWAMAGITIVVATGIFTLMREQQQARRTTLAGRHMQ